MIKDLNELEGLRLEAFRLSKGSYTFELDGNINEKQVSLSVSTSHQLTDFPGDSKDLESRSSEVVWPLLESTVCSVMVEKTEKRSEIIFNFSSGCVVMWKNEPSCGELVFVKNRLGKEWSVFL